MPKPIDPSKQASYITVRIPDDLRRKLEALALQEDRSASATARRAIEAYIAVTEARHG